MSTPLAFNASRAKREYFTGYPLYAHLNSMGWLDTLPSNGGYPLRANIAHLCIELMTAGWGDGDGHVDALFRNSVSGVVFPSADDNEKTVTAIAL